MTNIRLNWDDVLRIVSGKVKVQTEEGPAFDVSSGGVVHVEPIDLLSSQAGKRQLDALKRLQRDLEEKKAATG